MVSKVYSASGRTNERNVLKMCGFILFAEICFKRLVSNVQKIPTAGGSTEVVHLLKGD
jgi:hypothetical protein